MGQNHDKQVAREIRENRRGGPRPGAGRPRIFKGATTFKNIQLDSTDMARLAQIRKALSKHLISDTGAIRWLITYVWVNLTEHGPKELEAMLTGKTPAARKRIKV